MASIHIESEELEGQRDMVSGSKIKKCCDIVIYKAYVFGHLDDLRMRLAANGVNHVIRMLELSVPLPDLWRGPGG